MVMLQYGLSLFKGCNFEKAYKIIIKHGAGNLGLSYYLQGLYSKFGLSPVPKDDDIAKIFFEEALAEGYFPAAMECQNIEGTSYLSRIISLAENGDSFAKLEMANYHYGRYELTEARKWFYEAVEEGNYVALVELLKTYFSTDYDKDINQIINLLKIGEQHNIKYCTGNLAWFYYIGKGVEQNTELAITMLENSIIQRSWVDDFPNLVLDKILHLEAKHGNAEALFKLYLYSDDPDTADEWLGKAIEQGSAEAMFMKGSVCVGNNLDEICAWFRKAAEHGSSEAMFRLGEYIELGDIPAQGNEDDIFWYTKAAELGNPKALLRLAYKYSKNGSLLDGKVKAADLKRKAFLNGACFGELLRYYREYPVKH